MKKTFIFFASLTLGLMITSCQNGLEEVIDESVAQEELATTRAEEEHVDEMSMAELRSADINLTIDGSRIISGTYQEEYTVYADTTLSAFVIEWAYSSSILQKTAGGGNTENIKLKLVSSTNTSDTYLTVRLKDLVTDEVRYATTIYIGCNGPLANTSSLRVVRSSDGVEVYPSYVGLSPNTWYYAYFSNAYASNMTLQWIFTNAIVSSQYGYTAYFQTDSNGWATVTINGKMPGSTVYKYMMGATLYEGYDNSNGNDDENDEGGAEQRADE